MREVLAKCPNCGANIDGAECKFCKTVFRRENNGLPPSHSDNFSMIIEDIFKITGRGTVVTGKVDSGSISVGDIVVIGNIRASVKGIEKVRKIISVAKAGDICGLLLTGIEKEMIVRGQKVYISR